HPLAEIQTPTSTGTDTDSNSYHRTSLINDDEAKFVKKIVDEYTASGTACISELGIITPYQGQHLRICELVAGPEQATSRWSSGDFREPKDDGLRSHQRPLDPSGYDYYSDDDDDEDPFLPVVPIEVDFTEKKEILQSTVDKIQGGERKYMIMSLVRGPNSRGSIGFTANANRQWMGFSRAIDGTLLVCDVKTYVTAPVAGPFIAECRRQGRFFELRPAGLLHRQPYGNYVTPQVSLNLPPREYFKVNKNRELVPFDVPASQSFPPFGTFPTDPPSATRVAPQHAASHSGSLPTTVATSHAASRSGSLSATRVATSHATSRSSSLPTAVATSHAASRSGSLSATCVAPQHAASRSGSFPTAVATLHTTSRSGSLSATRVAAESHTNKWTGDVRIDAQSLADLHCAGGMGAVLVSIQELEQKVWVFSAVKLAFDRHRTVRIAAIGGQTYIRIVTALSNIVVIQDPPEVAWVSMLKHYFTDATRPSLVFTPHNFENGAATIIKRFGLATGGS
ncbi:hypothetical protein HDU88_008743, partial [Geranomyces variabilis]